MKFVSWIKKNVPKYAMVLYAIAILSLFIHILCICFTGFADFFSVYIAGFFRMLLAKLSGLYSFSLAEIIIISLPIIFIAIIFTVIRYCRRDETNKINRFFAGAFAIVSLFYSTFVFTYGMGYRGYTLDVKLGLDKQEVSLEDLKETAEYLAQKVNETSKLYVSDVEYKDSIISKIIIKDRISDEVVYSYPRNANVSQTSEKPLNTSAGTITPKQKALIEAKLLTFNEEQRQKFYKWLDEKCKTMALEMLSEKQGDYVCKSWKLI